MIKRDRHDSIILDDDDPMILESAESVLVTVSDAEMHQIPTLPLPVFRTEKRKTPRSVKPPLDAVLETFRSNVEDIVLAEGVAKHDGNQTAMHGTMGSLDPGTCQEWTSNSRLDIIIEVRDKTVSRMKEKDFTTRLHSKLVDIKTNRLFTAEESAAAPPTVPPGEKRKKKKAAQAGQMSAATISLDKILRGGIEHKQKVINLIEKKQRILSDAMEKAMCLLAKKILVPDPPAATLTNSDPETSTAPASKKQKVKGKSGPSATTTPPVTSKKKTAASASSSSSSMASGMASSAPTTSTPKKLTIDAVVTYVNSADAHWQADFQSHVKDYKHLPKASHDERRFDNNETICQCLGRIIQFAPYINKIFLVVASKSQVEENKALFEMVKANVGKIQVVFHPDIIPKEHLPTFNSNVIEAHIHRISGISDTLLYFNDDCLLGRETTVSDFFTDDGKLKVRLSEQIYLNDSSNPWVKTVHQNISYLKTFGVDISKDVRAALHSVQPQSKKILKKISDKIPQNLFGKFRQQTDYLPTCLLSTHIALKEGLAVLEPHDSDFFRSAILSGNLQMEIALNAIIVSKPKTFNLNMGSKFDKDIPDRVACFFEEYVDPSYTDKEVQIDNYVFDLIIPDNLQNHRLMLPSEMLTANQLSGLGTGLVNGTGLSQTFNVHLVAKHTNLDMMWGKKSKLYYKSMRSLLLEILRKGLAPDRYKLAENHQTQKKEKKPQKLSTQRNQLKWNIRNLKSTQNYLHRQNDEEKILAGRWALEEERAKLNAIPKSTSETKKRAEILPFEDRPKDDMVEDVPDFEEESDDEEESENEDSDDDDDACPEVPKSKDVSAAKIKIYATILQMLLNSEKLKHSVNSNWLRKCLFKSQNLSAEKASFLCRVVNTLMPYTKGQSSGIDLIILARANVKELKLHWCLEKSLGSLEAIHINQVALYEMLCSGEKNHFDAVNEDGKIVSGWQNADDSLFSAFLDMDLVNAICEDHHMTFADRMDFVSRDEVRIFGVKNKPKWVNQYQESKKTAKKYQKIVFTPDCKMSDTDYAKCVEYSKQTAKEILTLKKEIAPVELKRVELNCDMRKTRKDAKPGDWHTLKKVKATFLKESKNLMDLKLRKAELNSLVYRSNKAAASNEEWTETPLNTRMDIDENTKCHDLADNLDLRKLLKDGKVGIAPHGVDPGHHYTAVIGCVHVTNYWDLLETEDPGLISEDATESIYLSAKQLNHMDGTRMCLKKREAGIKANPAWKECLDKSMGLSLNNFTTPEEVDRVALLRLQIRQELVPFERSLEKQKADAKRKKLKETMLSRLAAQTRKLGVDMAKEHNPDQKKFLSICCQGNGYTGVNNPFGGRPRRNGLFMDKDNGRHGVCAQTSEYLTSQTCLSCLGRLVKAKRRKNTSKGVVKLVEVNGSLQCDNVNCRSRTGRLAYNTKSRDLEAAKCIQISGITRMLSDDRMPISPFQTLHEKRRRQAMSSTKHNGQVPYNTFAESDPGSTVSQERMV